MSTTDELFAGMVNRWGETLTQFYERLTEEQIQEVEGGAVSLMGRITGSTKWEIKRLVFDRYALMFPPTGQKGFFGSMDVLLRAFYRRRANRQNIAKIVKPELLERLRSTPVLTEDERAEYLDKAIDEHLATHDPESPWRGWLDPDTITRPPMTRTEQANLERRKLSREAREATRERDMLVKAAGQKRIPTKINLVSIPPEVAARPDDLPKAIDWVFHNLASDAVNLTEAPCASAITMLQAGRVDPDKFLTKYLPMKLQQDSERREKSAGRMEDERCLHLVGEIVRNAVAKSRELTSEMKRIAGIA